MNQQQLQKTLRASQYAELVLSNHLDALDQDYAIDQFLRSLSTEQIYAHVQTALYDIVDEAVWMRVLRILRARLMFRWIWQDANQLTDVVTLTRELSDFADACICAAKDFARISLIEKYGQPVGYHGKVQDLIVIAMGKLGAQELNLSSDIDLIFAFDEQGETEGGRKCVDVQQFCIFWGQKLIYLLDHITADGFVFRVDMRLRPWGDGSALAISHVALEKYLSQHGREWERYAWIKARIVNPSPDGDALLEMTRPFVFRRYVDYSAFEAMREMKAMIEREVARRNIEDDIKLGSGGIREVEFIVQVFQLIYGGSKLELQDRQCLVSLNHLDDAELLDSQAVTDLEDAYLFLRRVEHAIQALNDQQTQSLPTEDEPRQRIVDTLGFDDWAHFMAVLNLKRSKVIYQFEHLIKENGPEQTSSFSQLELKLNQVLDTDAQNLISEFWHSNSLKKLPAKAIQRLKTFWPYLIDAILESNQPQIALLRLMPLIESVMRRTVYLVMLIESKGALQRLVKMATVSPWICEELTQYPVLLDEFLSMDFELPKRQDLEDSLRQQLLRIEIDQVEDQMRVLRLFKKSNVLTVAASDVLAESPLMKISDALTDIAEVSVNATLHLAYQIVAKKHGFPIDAIGQRCAIDHTAFSVIGYGKVGGIELGYGSDLDLVFIHFMDEQADTDGLKPISGFEFAMRVAQKFMSLMTTQTLDGRVYEVDTRLRPSGEAGLLVTSLKAFEQYQHKSAWLWEHQALVRARSIAGELSLREKFEQLRCDILTQQRDPCHVRTEVLNMRQKMKDHLGSSKEQKKDGIFHLKQDAGGIVDIEFMAQYAVLAWSGTNKDLAHFSDNVRILEDAAKSGCLPSDDATALIQAYLRERAESHRLALANQSMQVSASDWNDTRMTVCKLWQRLIDPSAVFALDSE
jgi:[glutamine synthetase] adenylyltransferase / [glutamine synthetase]-adenylyl-L-tyrosine phosphorylase